MCFDHIYPSSSHLFPDSSPLTKHPNFMWFHLFVFVCLFSKLSKANLSYPRQFCAWIYGLGDGFLEQNFKCSCFYCIKFRLFLHIDLVFCNSDEFINYKSSCQGEGLKIFFRHHLPSDIVSLFKSGCHFPLYLNSFVGTQITMLIRSSLIINIVLVSDLKVILVSTTHAPSRLFRQEVPSIPTLLLQ